MRFCFCLAKGKFNLARLRPGRNEIFRIPVAIFCDHLPCTRDDVPCGSVIRTHADDLRPRIIVGETQHHFRARTPEPINRLVIIAHNSKIPILAGKQVNNVALHIIGILVLVHLDIPVFIPKLGKSPLVIKKDFICLCQHIIKVNLPLLLFQGLVAVPQELEQRLVGSAVQFELFAWIVFVHPDIKNKVIDKLVTVTNRREHRPVSLGDVH